MILKKVLILIIFILGISNRIYAQNFGSKPQDIAIADPARELRIGETLEYSVEWLGIPVGKIVLKVQDWVVINNCEAYHISAEALPNSFFRHFYDLEYRVDSYIDKKNFLPIRFKKVRRLNKKVNYVTIDFDHKKNEVRYKSWGSTLFVKISPLRNQLEAINPITTKIPAGTQDLFSSFYYFRILKIKPDHNYPVNIYYGQRNWPVKMKVEEPFIRDMPRRGSFAVVKFTPLSDLNDYVLGKRNFFVYLTVDPQRIPLEFRLNTAVGYIRGILQDLPPDKNGKI